MKSESEQDIIIAMACELIGKAVLTLTARGHVVSELSIRQWLIVEQEKEQQSEGQQRLLAFTIDLLSDERKVYKKRGTLAAKKG